MEHKVKTKKKFFRDDEENYIYHTVGQSSNPTIVLIYGYSGYHISLMEISELLMDDYYVVIPELPGWNDCPRFSDTLTINNYAKYLKKLCDHLAFKDISIFGHCEGAVVAIEFTYLYPERVKSVILASTPYLEGMFANKFYKYLADKTERSPRFVRPIFFFWRSRIITVPLDFLLIKNVSLLTKLQMAKSHIIRQSFQKEDSVQENWISLIRFNFNKLRNVKNQVHLIHGKKDIFISVGQVKKLQKILPNSTLDIISAAGHVPPTETPLELVNAMKKYLK